MTIVSLSNRAFLRVQGRDAHKFLQGLITNDMNKLNTGLFTAFLNAKVARAPVGFINDSSFRAEYSLMHSFTRQLVTNFSWMSRVIISRVLHPICDASRYAIRFRLRISRESIKRISYLERMYQWKLEVM